MTGFKICPDLKGTKYTKIYICLFEFKFIFQHAGSIPADCSVRKSDFLTGTRMKVRFMIHKYIYKRNFVIF